MITAYLIGLALTALLWGFFKPETEVKDLPLEAVAVLLYPILVFILIGAFIDLGVKKLRA